MEVLGILALFQVMAVGSPYASNPSPCHECVIDGKIYSGYIYAELYFTPGPNATKHTGFFSEDYNDVMNRVEDANMGSSPLSVSEDRLYYLVGMPPYEPQASLVRGTTYYWVVDEEDAQGTKFEGDIWEFMIRPFKAFRPIPPSGAVNVDTNVILEWGEGFAVVGHDIYFGINWDDVNDATFYDVTGIYRATQNPGENNYYPGLLELNTWYFWRIDEIQYSPPPGIRDIIYKGHVWAFYTGRPPYLFVDTSAVGSNNGSSWDDAYLYLQDALSEAKSNPYFTEIWVAEGTYYPDANLADPNGSGDRLATFQLKNGIIIKGGYAGFGETNPNERDIELYETILSGDIGYAVINTDNSYHVVTGSDTEPNAILDGFTITGGNANGSWPDSGGGGMINSSGSPTVNNCIFSRNSSSHTGGGMYNCLYSSLTVTNCRFINNSADNGGGMYNDLSSTTVVNCIFSGNTADADFGGGMCNGSSNPSVINCTFSSNSSRVGGGIYCNNCSLTLTNCILWGNTASIGTQIYDFGTTSATVSYCDVQGGWTGVGNINADPLFKDADGFDDIAGTEDDDLKLSKGSPCIDAGYNPAIPLTVSLDLAGNPRFFDDVVTIDTGYGGPPNVDMGAYEYFGQLVAHWKIDEIGGNIAYDSSGNGNHGSLYGDPNWQPAGGKTAGALEFDGIDDYVLENGGLNLNGLDGLTIALWIRSDVTGTDRGFIHFEDPCGHDNRGMRYDAFGATGGGVSLIKVGVTSDSPDSPPGWPGRQQLESSSNVQTTDWQHLAMTWSSGEQLKLYINGVLDTPTANEPALSGVLFGYNMVLIGRGGKYGQPGTDAMGWDGLLDDVRIYNYALSGDDIRWFLCDKPPRGDVNVDCRFDFVDLAILLSGWLDCGMMVPELCGQ